MKYRLFAILMLALNSAADAQLTEETSPAEETRPKVVLIGDSIRLSYAPVVIAELKKHARVISPKANGADSNNVLKHLDEWAIQAQPDLVHFNCGIHDTKRFKETKQFQVSPMQYEKNLREIVLRIRKETQAEIVFATSTPIIDERAKVLRADRNYELLNASIETYNAIALKVMQELNVPVNNLNNTLTHPPAPLTTDQLITSDGVHLTPTAQKLLGQQVTQMIQEHLSESSGNR